jgi:hypothetical protein
MAVAWIDKCDWRFLKGAKINESKQCPQIGEACSRGTWDIGPDLGVLFVDCTNESSAGRSGYGTSDVNDAPK